MQNAVCEYTFIILEFIQDRKSLSRRHTARLTALHHRRADQHRAQAPLEELVGSLADIAMKMRLSIACITCLP
eukprot:COSAG02_NODE_1279_length_13487_cov_7.611696_11_plen_73_part_00